VHKIVSSFPGDPAECLLTSRHHLYNSRLSIRRGQKALTNALARITESQASLDRTDALLHAIRKELIQLPSYLSAKGPD